MALHESYVCHCNVPRPRMEKGEDSGLCETCNGVYDENLYEKRLRQHVPDYHYETVHDYLMDASPHYRSLVP